MSNFLRRFLTGETLRYGIFGVLTMAINIASFRLLASVFEIFLANTVAFFIAVLFAYFTNSRCVFRTPFTYRSFVEFMSMRIGTLFVDDGGMLLLIRWGWGDLSAKIVVNMVIIGLNYLFSKLFIFRTRDKEEGKE